MFKKAMILTLLGLGLAACAPSEKTTVTIENNSRPSNVSNTEVVKNENSAGAGVKEITNTAEKLSNKTDNSSSPAVSATSDKTQANQVADTYIKGAAKAINAKGTEVKESRKSFYGDLDGDGDEDMIVEFIIEGFPETGDGNYYSQHIAAFRNENGKFTGITDEGVGTKLTRAANVTKIENGKIYFETIPAGENTKGKTVFVLKGNKLVEQK